MTPRHLMTSVVTVTRATPVGWHVDRLGRPLDVTTDEVKTVGRLVRDSSPEFEPVVDGVPTAVWKLYLPSDVDVQADDALTVDGKALTIIEAPDTKASPLTTAGYTVVTVREPQ